MNYSNSLISTRRRDETSKEAGDHSMTVKPLCGDPEISQSQRQGEEHMAKAKLPEPQTQTRGSHSLPTPDKEQSPHETRPVRLSGTSQPGDGAGHTPDNGRTGRLRAQYHHYLHTTGSPTQELAPAWRRSLHTTQRAGSTPGAASPRAGRGRRTTAGQPAGKLRQPWGKGGSQKPKKNV